MTKGMDEQEFVQGLLETAGGLPKSEWPVWAEGYLAVRPLDGEPGKFVLFERMLFTYDVMVGDEGGKGLPVSYAHDNVLTAVDAFSQWPTPVLGWARNLATRKDEPK